MKITDSVRRQLWAQGGAWVVLLIALAGLVSWVAREYRTEWDVTANARNTLSQGTQDAVKTLQGPVRIVVYAVAKDGSGNDVHKFLRDKFRPWQKLKPDLAVEFVDPREDPKRANSAGLRSPNELVIEHNQRSEHLPLADFNEQNFANTLLRLSRISAALIYALDGHGERKFDGQANHDLGEFGRQLRARGMRVAALNTAVAPDVPRNASLLVIASPQTDLQANEIALVQRHISAGGNLLWLIDPEPLRGLDTVAETLGLVLTPGTVVDPSLRQKSGPPILATAANYARHPVTATFRLNTLFPASRSIGHAEREGWRATPLVEVAQRGWVEMGKLEDAAFDKDKDLPGPINIATAFERNINDKAQRVIVIGNGNFLSNTFLGNGGNLQLGMAMMSWLTGDEKMINIPPRPAADVAMNIDQMTLYLIAFSFLLVLPMAFAITGVVVWWRRRKAL
jgi:ABC-type uncharacterized transport system involved in gliding motility auxiliary subunit